MVSSCLRMRRNFLLQIAFVCGLFYKCSGTCTFPTDIRDTWISSEKNELVFAASSFTGYTVHIYSTSSFTCELNSGTKYMVKSNSFSRFNLQFYAYMCLDLREVTSVSTGELYYYYKASAEEADANNERVVIRLTSVVISDISDICTVSNYTDVPYSVLMKNGAIDNVASTCPIPFLGNFAYTYDTGSGNLCPNGSYVQVCDTKTTMTFDYTTCSQIQAYSAGGVTKCVYSSSSSDVYTVHVYNTDATTDQSTTYRFTCYRVTGYKTVYATQYPGDCPATMNTTYVASPGAALVMTSSVVCAYDESTSALSAGVIAAIVIICFLLILAGILLLVFYFYNKRKKKKQAEWEAANKKIDPDELSPNMRLGLPDESKYDLDRLMYSPDMKNGLLKRNGRKDMMGLEGLEGYNEGDMYMDEDQRQTALEAQMFNEKRKRKDKKDEFSSAHTATKVFSDRIKDLAKGRKRPMRAVALAKLKLRPRPRPMVDTPDGTEAGSRATKTKDIVIQVEEAEGENKRKTRFADEDHSQQNTSRTLESKSAKKLEDIDTLSDIVDNEMGVDLSDDEPKELRLKLPNLRPEKKEKKKRPKDRFSLGSNQQTHGMPHKTRFMPPKSKSKPDEDSEPVPLSRNIVPTMTPLARIHRKDNPKAWKDAFGDANLESMDIEELKKNLPENRWRKLLEELYRDKKYFDYVKKSTSTTEKELFSSADESLQFLYGRALFWEQQQPIPARPPSHVKRMYSRYESPKSSKTLQRSSTTLSRSGHKQLPRTPSTQVSRLRRRDTLGKKAKEEANRKEASLSNGLPPSLVFFEGGTQTDFSPVPPISPYMVTQDEHLELDRMSLPGSVDIEERLETPVIPYSKEVTRSDIKLVEYADIEGDGEDYVEEDEDDYQQYDAEIAEQNQTYTEEDITMAI